MSGPFIYVESKLHPELRFQVLGFDEATGMGRLKSSIGVEFDRLITKEELAKRNYRLRASPTELEMGDWPATAPLSTVKEPVRATKGPPPPKMSAEEQTAASARNSAAIQGMTTANPFGDDDEE